MGRPKRSKRRMICAALAVVVAAALVYGGVLSWQVTRAFDERGWDVPAQIFAAPLELYSGRRMSPDELVIELERHGYRRDGSLRATGTYRPQRSEIELRTRAFETADSVYASQIAEIRFAGGRIERITGQSGESLPILELEPMLIGSVFPAHGEDRIVLKPEETPDLLKSALIAVEDRRFENHLGIDLRAIARAFFVNLREGEIRQGGSTLTQQLVRSYFLSTERTLWRKIREAFMALALELRHDKATLLQAYVNEIYLAQDGARAIHGFGLASRFYFGKPLAELELHQIALLVAQVRGPSYYDPRRHEDRALARRDLVLRRMRDAQLISEGELRAASGRGLDLVMAGGKRSAYYAGFLDLVRRQLRRDYAEEDLLQKGLKVYTSLDPAIQSIAESRLIAGLDSLQPGRPALEGALIVTNPHNAEVRALVGSRRTGFDGFNRALDAKRQIGSLIKPAVYLAAIESGQYSLADLIDDAPVHVELDDGSVWSPGNFNDETHGTVTAVRALAESFNMATVRLGMEVGANRVAELLARLGLETPPPAYPSLLLGALELSPFEVTQVYNTIANGGFRAPLRGVRAVVDARGREVKRFRLSIEQTADAGAVFALNRGLVQVMERGTGRNIRRALPPALTTAGKTGTSDGLRDSWFAGFTNGHLVVAWVGNDANEPIGLTGSTGAGRISGSIVAALETRPFAPPAPRGVETAWIDYDTGLETEARCPAAVALAMPPSALPPIAAACGSTRQKLGSRVRRWLRSTF